MPSSNSSHSKDRSLSICLFGPHLFQRAGRPFRIHIRGATLELLVYLVVHADSEMRREYVAETVWDQLNEARQRSAFNSAVWRIRKILKDLPGVSLKSTSRTISLSLNDISVDTRALTTLVRECADHMNAELADRLLAALDATESPFLSGRVPDWALAEQERMMNVRLRGMTILMHWYGDCRRYEDALEIGRHLLGNDPFRETAQIDMMWLYVMNGQRANALRQYQTYTALLERELSIEPMAETRALYNHIRRDLNSAKGVDDDRKPQGSSAARNKSEFDCILESIERSRRQLYQTLRHQLGST
jgi:two-component SAPR family response regulator